MFSDLYSRPLHAIGCGKGSTWEQFEEMAEFPPQQSNNYEVGFVYPPADDRTPMNDLIECQARACAHALIAKNSRVTQRRVFSVVISPLRTLCFL
jgi:hypothetical protein